MSTSENLIAALVRAAGFQQIADAARPGSKKNWLAQHLADTHRREAKTWADRIASRAAPGHSNIDRHTDGGN